MKTLQSILIFGPDASSNLSKAEEFVQEYMSLNEKDMKFMRQGLLPDVLTASAQVANGIKIEDMRNIIDFANTLSPTKKKTIIIENAELMTIQASNALLKTLEEPPEGLIFILTTRHLRNILPTIRSRCISIKNSQNEVNTSNCSIKWARNTLIQERLKLELKSTYPSEQIEKLIFNRLQNL